VKWLLMFSSDDKAGAQAIRVDDPGRCEVHHARSKDVPLFHLIEIAYPFPTASGRTSICREAARCPRSLSEAERDRIFDHEPTRDEVEAAKARAKENKRTRYQQAEAAGAETWNG
jgi:hypothetical protein